MIIKNKRKKLNLQLLYPLLSRRSKLKTKTGIEHLYQLFKSILTPATEIYGIVHKRLIRKLETFLSKPSELT